MDNNLRLAISTLLLLACFAWAVPAGAADSVTATALDELVRQLVQAAAVQDGPAIDHIVCLDDLLHSHMAKREALGLEPQAGLPEYVEARRTELRTRVYAFVDRLVSRGGEIEATDATRVELFVDEGSGYETLPGADGAVLEIDGGGTLAVKMLAMPRPADIAVVRVRGRWCLSPVGFD